MLPLSLVPLLVAVASPARAGTLAFDELNDRPLLGLHLFAGPGDGVGVGVMAGVDHRFSDPPWTGDWAVGPQLGVEASADWSTGRGFAASVGPRFGVDQARRNVDCWRNERRAAVLVPSVLVSGQGTPGLRLAAEVDQAWWAAGVRVDRWLGAEGRWRGPSAVLGARLWAKEPCYQVNVVPGRPLRCAGGIARTGGLLRHASPAARRWLHDAADELMAARSFQRLAAELRQAGAPAALVRAVGSAAIDEVGHAAACLRQAARHGGAAALVLPAVAPPRPADRHTVALARLAWESRWDGQDNEGRAASRAAAEAERTPDARAQAVLARIAREEAGHAALGQEIVSWAVRSGGRTVRAALEQGPPR